ncbi:peptide arginase family protein [Cohnella endophytica]|nr:UPF0489 family protein [Cohnella endophytica]
MNYRVCYPENRIYISRNHQWAFAAWAIGKEEGWTGSRPTLLHVDAHLDDTWDGVMAEGLHEMECMADYLNVAGKLEIDNFIWAGFAAELIDRIIYVCPKDEDPSDPFDLSDWNLNGEQLAPIKALLKNREYSGSRFESLHDLKERMGSNLFPLVAGSVILDLDLDVFAVRDLESERIRLKPEALIKEELAYLRDLCPYVLITVALSPSFCGSEDNCEQLYGLFLDVFGLRLSEAIPW